LVEKNVSYGGRWEHREKISYYGIKGKGVEKFFAILGFFWQTPAFLIEKWATDEHWQTLTETPTNTDYGAAGKLRSEILDPR
jgi:hypothetical protein